MHDGRIALSALLVTLVATMATAQALKPCDLMEMLDSKDPAVAQRGVDGFMKMGANGAVPLVCFLAGKAPNVPRPGEAAKRRAEATLVKLGAASVPAAVQYLPGGDEELRTRLVRVLAQIKDGRRDTPLLKLWESEKSDRVRSALVAALVSIDRTKALGLLRQRVASALPRELQAIAAQLALHGTAADLTRVLAQVSIAKRPAFIAEAIAQVKAMGGAAADRAIRRLKDLL
jgi:hypothetical protein